MTKDNNFYKYIVNLSMCMFALLLNHITTNVVKEILIDCITNLKNA